MKSQNIEKASTGGPCTSRERERTFRLCSVHGLLCVAMGVWPLPPCTRRAPRLASALVWGVVGRGCGGNGTRMLHTVRMQCNATPGYNRGRWKGCGAKARAVGRLTREMGSEANGGRHRLPSGQAHSRAQTLCGENRDVLHLSSEPNGGLISTSCPDMAARGEQPPGVKSMRSADRSVTGTPHPRPQLLTKRRSEDPGATRQLREEAKTSQ